MNTIIDDAKNKLDPQSESLLLLLENQEKIRNVRVPGVRTVLVVLSAAGVVYDVESLRQKILLTYSDATVFFRTTRGLPIGAAAPQQVDLLIDFTGPRQRQGLFYAKRLRRMARVAVGRNAGFFRKGIYDRLFDEKANGASLPTDVLEKERFIQKQVLALVGIALTQAGDTPQDRSHSIALDLPAMARL